METTIFFSWQSDGLRSICKDFISEALNEAIEGIGDEIVFYHPIRMESDTTGISGTPEIISEIFERIRNCAVFVGDVTLIGKSGKKKLPNANVSIELGYAAATIGWDRIINVMNENPSYGSWNEQIFDLKNRRKPICYKLSRTDDSVLKNKTKQDLINKFREYIKSALYSSHLKAEKIYRRLDIETFKFIQHFGQVQYFNLQQNEANMQSQLIRLLDLGLIYFDSSQNENKIFYAYHWSYFGELIIKKLNIERKT